MWREESIIGDDCMQPSLRVGILSSLLLLVPQDGSRSIARTLSVDEPGTSLSLWPVRQATTFPSVLPKASTGQSLSEPGHELTATRRLPHVPRLHSRPIPTRLLHKQATPPHADIVAPCVLMPILKCAGPPLVSHRPIQMPPGRPGDHRKHPGSNTAAPFHLIDNIHLPLFACCASSSNSGVASIKLCSSKCDPSTPMESLNGLLSNYKGNCILAQASGSKAKRPAAFDLKTCVRRAGGTEPTPRAVLLATSIYNVLLFAGYPCLGSRLTSQSRASGEVTHPATRAHEAPRGGLRCWRSRHGRKIREPLLLRVRCRP